MQKNNYFINNVKKVNKSVSIINFNLIKVTKITHNTNHVINY